jgi:hypothetical protein
MTFEKFFRAISYAAVFCGFLSLWVSGTFGIFGSALFVAVMIAAWLLEDTRWQISERLGTAFIVLALPIFYFLWRLRFFGFSNAEGMLPGVLARMILVLAAIKLLQKKSDRDWIFLYLMAFFEVLLAAGLSISAMYLASFLAYLLVMVCAVIAFEIRKTIRLTAIRQDPTHKVFLESKEKLAAVPVRRLPAAAIALIFFAAIVGLPLFFLLPRVGGAGFGSDQSKLLSSSGFGETVELGGSGRIQENDAVVMRVRVDDNAMLRGDTHWRGVVLDTFDNHSWKKSLRIAKQQFSKGDLDLIRIDTASGRESLATQTVYLEPLDTPVLFGLSRMVGLQGDFPMLTRDSEGSVTVAKSGDRMSYKVISDRSLPSDDRLRADSDPYSSEMGNYLNLPDGVDPRIAKLSTDITSGFVDRFSKAKAVESYLQNNFGYTLELKAGGSQPLADFLFNVKEGHCEYFATAMAVMLRTQGIATRVVNGFQQGEYNDAADIWIVRQRHAHSWVEVYFPKEKVWVPFDPTPFAGQTAGRSAAGILGNINKYLEALETYWIQYFVAFDDQEQQSLVRSARKGFFDYQARTAVWLNRFQDILADWWVDVRGDNGLQTRMAALLYGLGYLIVALIVFIAFVWMYRKLVKSNVWATLANRITGTRQSPAVEFYETMQNILSRKGYVRDESQTPLEFAFEVGMPEAVSLTQKYNRVRFGEKKLSPEEKNEVENLIRSLQNDRA